SQKQHQCQQNLIIGARWPQNPADVITDTKHPAGDQRDRQSQQSDDDGSLQHPFAANRTLGRQWRRLAPPPRRQRRSRAQFCPAFWIAPPRSDAVASSTLFAILTRMGHSRATLFAALKFAADLRAGGFPIANL